VTFNGKKESSQETGQKSQEEKIGFLLPRAFAL